MTKMLRVYIFTREANTELWKRLQIVNHLHSQGQPFTHWNRKETSSGDKELPELATAKYRSLKNLSQDVENENH